MKHHTREDFLNAFGRVLDTQYRLRQECPWDKKQTFESLRPNSIEEMYELCDAIMKHDAKNICKELGDVLEHIVFYAMMGAEEGEFDIADVCNGLADKLMFRHPFINWNESKGNWGIDNRVYTVASADLQINSLGQVVYRNSAVDQQLTQKPEDASGVELTWEQIKQKERDGNTSVLSGVPESLPSLIKATRIQEKAHNVGFDFKQADDAWKKVHEELSELEAEIKHKDKDKSTGELGDFIFSLVNVARFYHLNPDTALERTNQKFIRRFNYIEQKVKEQHKKFGDLTLEEMDAFWNEAKKLENEKK